MGVLLVSGLSFPSQALQPPALFAAHSGGEVTSPKSQDQAAHSPPVGKSHDSHVSTMQCHVKSYEVMWDVVM